MTTPSDTPQATDVSLDSPEGGRTSGRLMKRLQALATFGATPNEQGGGVTRPAYGAAHAEAAARVADWMREAGLEVGRDDVGNLIGVLPGRNRSLAAIGVGSHLDSVPNGGAFDGALGVLAAIEAAQSIAESEEPLERDLVVLGFADEEGNNFGIGVLSAQLWIDEIEPEAFQDVRDPVGRSLRDYLEAFDVPGVPIVTRPDLGSYLEIHVEQGPILAAEGASAAAVEAIVGISRLTVHFSGQANHAGTTPMSMRQDALTAASELVLAVRSLTESSDGRAVGTVGVLEVEPGATNVIPGLVKLRVELRCPDPERLLELRSQVEHAAEDAAARFDVTTSWDAWHTAPPVAMDPRLLEATQDALADVGLPVRTMPSWAGHDAKVLARRMPVGMLFLPSVEGVSHAPNEWTDEEHIALAGPLLEHAIRRVDQTRDEAS